jgi:uncharacterized repeat protein (TIGR01451 family)
MKRYKNHFYFLLSLVLSASFLLFTGIGTNAAQIILRGISGSYPADLLSKVFPPKNVLPTKTTGTRSAKAGSLLPAVPACGAATVTRSSPPYIYIDTADLTNAGATYIAYKICNDTGAAIADAWVKLSSSSAIVTLAANEDGLYHIGPLAVNACATVYFYVKASGVTGTTQNLTVEVYEGNPTGGGTLVCGNNVFGYTVEDVLDANANKPMSVIVSGDTNSCFTVTASGATGNIGSHNNSNITYTPAASLSWLADAYELTDVNFTYPNAPVGGVNDVLWVENLTSSNEGNYTVTYTFCKRQNVALPAIMPYTYIASGANNNKYGPVDPQVTVTLSAMKSVSPTGLVAAGSTLTYTISVTNTGASVAATGMTLTDAIPANTTYIAGSTTLNGAAIADNAGPTMPYSTAREIHSPGEPNGTINPGETATVTFQVTVNNPVPAGVTSVSNFATYAGTNIPSTNTNTVTNSVCNPPTTATVGGPQTICALSTTAGLGGNTPSSGTGTWSVVSGGTGTFSPNATTPNATFTHTSGTGPIVLRWTISNGSCTSSTADVTVNITPQPTTATVGGSQTICESGMTAGLGGNTPSNGTGLWSIVSGGTGTFSPDATTPNATFTHTGGTGPVVLRWTISNGSCTSSTADVTVKISQPPTVANAGPDQQMCGNGPVTLAANTPLVGTGTWSVASGGTGTFTPNANTPNATFTPTGGAVPYTLRWTISNSPCNDSFDEVDLLCNAATPPLTLKVVDPLVCNGPGGLTSATGILTNPNNTPQQASFTVTLPPQLTALQGTCNASINPGGCVIAANGSSVTWNGTIPAGQSVTIAYQAQIAANTPQGTQLCVDATGTVGGAMVNLTECLNVNCPSCLLPGIANVNASQQKAGSLLVFPYYVSNAVEQKNTRLTISNVGTQQALIHLFLVDGTSCIPADLFLCLTPNATYSFTALDYDPENTGFIYAVAINNEGRPIPNNVLIGNAFVKDGDYVDTYGAEAFWRHDTAMTNIAGGFAVLGLNGTQYDAAPIQFAVEIQSPIDAVGQKIVVAPMSGDLTGGQTNLGAAFPALMNAAAQNCVGLAANANEKTASFTGLLSGGCLKTATLSTSLPRVPTGLGGLMPSGTGGTLSFRVGAGVGLLMTPRTGTNQWHGIRGLHKTAVGNVALAIPVFIPTC